MGESIFVQRTLKPELKRRFPGIIILKQNPNLRQGIQDLILLYRDKWAAIETKREKTAERQVNQDYYEELLNDMSFAAFVEPSNYLEVLDELEKVFYS